MLKPIYGLDAVAISPPWALFASLFLIIGIAGAGFFVGRYLTLFKKSAQQAIWQQWCMSPTLGMALLGPLLYPLVLFAPYPKEVLTGFALVFLIIGLGVSILLGITLFKYYRFHGFSLRNLFTYPIKTNITPIFLVLLLLTYVLVAMSPPTDIDALDYHLGVPLALLNSGSWIYAPEWFTSRLAGLGEVFIALGLSIGAEQFGSLLQYCGLLAIVACITRPSSPAKDSQISLVCALSYAASPVLIWLVGTAKPLLLPIGMTTVALLFLLEIGSPYSSERKQHCAKPLCVFAVICSLTLCAALMKLNFLLSASIVILITLIVFKTLGALIPAFFLLFGMGGLILIPPALWKSLSFGGDWFTSIYQPLPGNWPGTDHFIHYLRNFSESSTPFPLSLLITYEPGQITATIGIGVLLGLMCLILLARQLDRSSIGFLIILASTVLIFLGSILGQIGGRFYLEPLAWIFLVMRFQNKPSQFLNSKILLWGIWSQALLILGGALFCVWILLPGAFSSAQRTAIQDKYAFQGAEMHWANSVLPPNAILLMESRNKALAPRPSISLDWSYYLTPQFQRPTADLLLDHHAKAYLNIIKNRQASHILIQGDPDSSPWKGCFGKGRFGPFKAQTATRNPFNAGEPYDAWLIEFNSQELPFCLKE